MPPVKKPAKPGKPNEPKKPSSRSKTKNAECSQAASTWQLSLRGKATATAETYQTLAKCRALASSQRKADSYGRTGKLSEQGKTALESRLQSRFESGLITDKSRKAKLADLLAKRKAAQGAAGVVAKSATTNPTPPKYSLGGQLAPGRGTKYRSQAAKDLAGIRDAARKGDMRKVADLAERSLDMKVIPSKFDETKVAAIGRYRGARWESMTVSQLRKKMTEGEKTYAWMASQKKR